MVRLRKSREKELNELLDNLLERPGKQKLAILAVMIILIAALYYSFLYSPRADQLAKLADSVEIARNEKMIKTQKTANLPRLRKDLQQLDAELKKAVAQLPDKREIAELLSNISAKAQQVGLDVLLFRPRPEAFQDFYAEVPVDITVKGNFHNTVSFFDEVGRMNRLVNIDHIGFKNPTVNGDNIVLETTSVATAFRFLDEGERKKVAEDKKKAAKTKR
jgi:type IV pilus assembly protein PilO